MTPQVVGPRDRAGGAAQRRAAAAERPRAAGAQPLAGGRRARRPPVAVVADPGWACRHTLTVSGYTASLWALHVQHLMIASKRSSRCYLCCRLHNHDGTKQGKIDCIRCQTERIAHACMTLLQARQAPARPSHQPPSCTSWSSPARDRCATCSTWRYHRIDLQGHAVTAVAAEPYVWESSSTLPACHEGTLCSLSITRRCRQDLVVWR